MPNSATLLADLFEWLAVDDVVIAVVDVPAELESGLVDENASVTLVGNWANLTLT